MVVLPSGVSSGSSAVAEKVITHKQQGDDVVVVVSAMSGETNRLVELANAISDQPTARELDVLLSTRENR